MTEPDRTPEQREGDQRARELRALQLAAGIAIKRHVILMTPHERGAYVGALACIGAIGDGTGPRAALLKAIDELPTDEEWEAMRAEQERHARYELRLYSGALLTFAMKRPQG